MTRREDVRSSGGLLTVAAAFCAAVVVRAVLAAALLSPQTELLWADLLTYELPMLALIVVSSVLTLRLTGVEHRFWGMLLIATTLVLAGELYWTWYAVTRDIKGPPPDDPSRLLTAAAAIVFLSLVVMITRFGSEPLASRLRFYIDVLSGMLVVYALTYWYVALPAVGALEGGGQIGAVALAFYPVVGGAILLGSIAVLVGWKSHHWRRWERLAIAALIVYSVGLLSFPAWYPQMLAAPQAGPGWFTFVLGMGYFLLLAAAVDRLQSVDPAVSEPWPVPVVGPAWIWRLYPVVIAGMLPLIGLLSLSVAALPLSSPVLVTTGVLAIVLAARSWLSALERARQRARAFTDPVTGVRSMDGFDQRVEQHLRRGAERGREMSLVLADIAGLGLMNDRLGHAAGDRALKRLAEVLVRELPRSGEVVRLADDEIVALLPDSGAEDAASYARRVYGRYRIACVDEAEPAEVSIGIAVFPEDALDSGQLLVAARAAERSARIAEHEPIVRFSEVEGVVFDAEEHLARARMRSLRATVRTLAEAVDARDPATRHHSANVAELAVPLCQVLGLDDEQAQMIGLAALMHDVGKIGVRDEVLLKPGPLSSIERAEVEQHARLGERILEPAGLVELLPIVRHHHERWDGTGYPDGLAGEEIPLGSRVLAVCDVFETITSGRPYRPAGTAEEAVAEVVACAGTQFDPQVAYAFGRMVAGLNRTAGARPRLEGEVAGADSGL